MALPSASNTIKVAINGVLTGQECINVFHFKAPSSVTEALMDNLAADVETWLDSFKALVTSSWSCTSVTLTDLTTSSGLSKTYGFSTKTGTLSGAPKPNNVSAVVTSRTNSRGRSFRGRTYIGGVGDNSTDTTLDLDPTWMSSVASVFVSLLNSSAFHSCVISIVSYFANKVVRGAAVVTPITAFSMDSHIDSQRRRLSGRGA